MLKEYLIAILQHRRECLEDLDSLASIAILRPFNRIERRAAERTLQVLIESCIGVAKHWLKAAGKNQPLDAYENFNTRCSSFFSLTAAIPDKSICFR